MSSIRPAALIVQLKQLSDVLCYRIEQPHHPDDYDDSPPISEELFYKHLYVPLPVVENEILRNLKGYQMPVLVLGKQGTGKTSAIGQAIRLLREHASFTSVVHRCTMADAPRFATVEALDAFLRAHLDFDISKHDTNIYDLILCAYRRDQSYLESSEDLAAKRLFASLRRYYDDEGQQSKTKMSFRDWILYALVNRRDEIRNYVRQFESSCALSTLVDLASAQHGSDHSILFVIDNIDSLLDSDSIHQAISLLVRADSLVGKHGKVLVASRPRSFFTSNRESVPLPDAGHNLFETIHIAKYLDTVVHHLDESLQMDSDSNQLAHLDKGTSQFHWAMLMKRLDYVIASTIPELKSESESFRSLVIEVRKAFESSGWTSQLVMGMSNHSARSYLLAIINFLDYMLREYRACQSIQEISDETAQPLATRLLSASSEPLVDRRPSTLLYSHFCYFLGAEGAELPGVQQHRIRLGATLERYRKQRVPHNADILTFYILRRLKSCPVAQYFHDGTHPGGASSVKVRKIVESLVPFGFSEREIIEGVSNLVRPDRWDLPILDFADHGNVLNHDSVGLEADIQLEARGWLLAHILPFRFHYWLGDLRSHYKEPIGGSESIVSARRIARVLEHIIWFADMEIEVVRRSSDLLERRKAIEEYGKITHIAGAWCHQEILGSARRHLMAFRANLVRMDDLRESIHIRAMDDLVTIIPRLENALASVAQSRVEEDNGYESLITSSGLEFWQRWKSRNAGLF